MKVVAVASLLSLIALAAQGCSAGDRGSDDAEGELKRRQNCGGIAGLRCPSGKVCHMTDHHPDAMGVCENPNPGEEGGTCGGIAGIQCDDGLKCQYDDDDQGGGRVVMGMPAPRDAGSSNGPPPGAMGMPRFPDQSGTCVRDSSGPPPGALGMPIHH